MEVGDLELLMLVNNYQQRFNEPTFSTLDDIPEGYKYQGVADFVMARKEVGYIPGTRTQ